MIFIGRRAVLVGASMWLLTGLTDLAWAADEPRNPPLATAEDPDYAAGSKAIEAGQFATAIPLLERATTRDPRNADAYNLLAYATRRNGDAAGAIPIYEKALTIDPRHRGAHESIGEAYLMLGNVAKAREHLAQLDRLGTFSCSEYRDLTTAIETWEKTGKVSVTTW
jgi:tetratricopeptide (TPR) repeat protein